MHTKNTTIILIVAIALLNLWHMGLDIHIPSFPAMIVDLDTNSNLVQLTVVLTMLGFGFSQFFYGPASDHYGRRVVALTGLIIFTLATGLAIVAPSIEILLIARFIQGLGLGAAGTVTGAMMRDIFTGNKLIQAFSYISIAIALSPLVAPVIGGYIQEYLGWRYNFALLFFYAIGLLVIFYLLIPETMRYKNNNNLSVTSALKQYRLVFSNRQFLSFVLCLILIYSGEIAYLITVPIIFQHELGLSPTQTGWLIIISGSGLFIGSTANSRLINSYTSMQLLKTGIILIVTAAISMLMVALLLPMSVLAIVLPMLVYMAGLGFIFPNCLGGIMNLFPQQAGLANSLSTGLLMLGVGVINSITVWMPADNSAIPLALLLATLALLLSANYIYGIKHQN